MHWLGSETDWEIWIGQVTWPVCLSPFPITYPCSYALSYPLSFPEQTSLCFCTMLKNPDCAGSFAFLILQLSLLLADSQSLLIAEGSLPSVVDCFGKSIQKLFCSKSYTIGHENRKHLILSTMSVLLFHCRVNNSKLQFFSCSTLE